MKIKEVNIRKGEQERKFIFDDKINLIYSVENSKGKTTLLRSILYGLGYNIPATDGIETFDDFYIEIICSNNSKQYKLNRHRDIIELYDNEDKITFVIPEQVIELHSILFEIENEVVLNNLLAVFYIDQEKGWTLLNRGVIIGKNRFNIEDFISALSDKEIINLKNEINKVSEELKKYKSLKSIAEYKKNLAIEEISSFSKKDDEELYSKQKYLLMRKEELASNIKEISDILKDNKKLIEYIERLDIFVKISEKENIKITKENIMNFQENQIFYETRKKELEIQLANIKTELSKIDTELNQRNMLYDMKTVADEIDEMLQKVNIDEAHIEKIIGQLTKRRNKLSRNARDILSDKNPYIASIYGTIKKYAKELGIEEYIKSTSNFILTNKLKGMTGRILTQTVFCFKLAYILEIKKKYNVNLPLIIDSPKTNELADKASMDMMKILERDFNEHQVIFASIYKFDGINKKKIEMYNNLFY